jgi:hypothetical protein
VIIGSRGRIETTLAAPWMCEASIHGMLLFSVTREIAITHAARGRLGNGTLHPLVGQEFALADAPKAP